MCVLQGGHFSASCESVNDFRARFEILKRDGRCFVCLSLGPQSTSCEKSASAIARNEDGTKSTRVKILFDNGSQRSYVTDNLKSRLGLNSTKREMLHLNTFGGKILLEKEMRGSNLVP